MTIAQRPSGDAGAGQGEQDEQQQAKGMNAADAKKDKSSLEDFDNDFTSWYAHHRRRRDQERLQQQQRQHSASDTASESKPKRKPRNVEIVVDRALSGNLVAPAAAATAASSLDSTDSFSPSSLEFGGAHGRYANLASAYHHRGFKGGSSRHGAGAAANPAAAASGYGHFRGAGIGSGLCAADEALRVEFNVDADNDQDGKLYGSSWSAGYHTFDRGAGSSFFQYDIMWLTDDCNCGVEIEVGSDFRLRDHAGLDGLGYSPHSERNANMSAVAYKQWYRRRWKLPESIAGSFMDKVTFSALGRSGVGSKGVALFRNIVILKVPDAAKPDVVEVKKSIWRAGSNGPMSIQNSFFKGSFETKCQPPFIVSVADSPMSPGGPPRIFGPYPLQRGERTTVAFAVELSTVVATSDTVLSYSAPASASASSATARSSTSSQQPQCFDARSSLNRDLVSRKAQHPSPVARPLLVQLFHEIARERLSQQVVEPLFIGSAGPKRWGPSGGIFNRQQHKLLRRTAILVLNWTARVKLLPPSSLGHAQDDVTLWDLLLARLRQQQQRVNTSIDDVASTDNCPSRFHRDEPRSGITDGVRKPPLTAFQTRAGCALHRFFSARSAAIAAVEVQRDSATAAFDRECAAENERLIAARRKKLNGEDAPMTQAEREEEDRRAAARHERRTEIADAFAADKEDVALDYDEKFIRLAHSLAHDRAIALDGGFPLLASAVLDVPAGDDAFPLLVNQLVSGESGVALARSLRKLREKQQQTPKSANEPSSSTPPPPPPPPFAELEVKVHYVVLALSATYNMSAPLFHDGGDGPSFEDVHLDEARIMSATFTPNDF